MCQDLKNKRGPPSGRARNNLKQRVCLAVSWLWIGSSEE